MHLFLSLLLAVGIFLFSDSIRYALKNSKKRQACLGLVSGLILSSLSLCLIVFF